MSSLARVKSAQGNFGTCTYNLFVLVYPIYIYIPLFCFLSVSHNQLSVDLNFFYVWCIRISGGNTYIQIYLVSSYIWKLLCCCYLLFRCKRTHGPWFLFFLILFWNWRVETYLLIDVSTINFAGKSDEAIQLFKRAIQVMKDSNYLSPDDSILEKMRVDLAELLHVAGR